MVKKNFFYFVLFFFSFFLFKNIKATPQDVIIDCPGFKIFKKWCAGEHIENDIKSCVMVSMPIANTGKPPYKRRGEIYTTIYHIPSQESIGVVYVTTGYSYKKDSVVKIKIDKKKPYEFNNIEDDTAFSDDENVDKQVIIEMKKGTRMKIIGFSSRGTETTDTYSLSGFTAAYNYISKLCNVKN